MADHVDENAETSESKSLDQSAIDEAIAAMQMDDTETGQVAGKSASDKDSVAKAGKSDAENVDQGDIDAAIAAMQAEATEDVDVAAVDESGSESVGQEEIDAALAPMQADNTEDDGTDAKDEPEPESDAQKDINDTIAAMQDDAAGESEAISERQSDSDVGLDNSKNAGDAEPEVQAEVTKSLANDGDQQPSEADGASVVDEMPENENDPHSDSLASSLETVGAMKEESEQETELEPDATEHNPVLDEDNTFAELEDRDLEEPKPARAMSEAEELATMTTSFDDDRDFSGLVDEDTEMAAGIASDEQVEASDSSSDYTAVLAEAESAPVATADMKKSVSGKKAAESVKSGSKKKYVGILVIGATIIIGLAVIFGPDYYASWKTKTEEPQSQTTGNEKDESVPAPVTPAVKVILQNPYQEKLQEVARLRVDLLAKKDEIDQLKVFYRDGISELEEELQQEAARYKVQTLEQAVQNYQIELDLRSIQRRWAYIDELEKPSHWLYQGSEELLFLSRRAKIDLQMSAVADGIELTRHTRHLNASLQKYQLAPERLAIDLSNSRLRPLKDIWEAIGAENKIIAQHAVANGDQAIIAEICDGNTGRIADLRTLTIKASKCLAQIESSELFLNQLTSLSPVAAKYLSAWSGQWLCLNGFRELSPDVARHLFRWDGDWISLNGLEAFPPQIGEMLLSWQGRQLELMGLVYNQEKMDRIGLQQLFDWEKSGGKLFVPENIRVEMDRLK